MKTRTYAMLIVVLLVTLVLPTSVGLAKGKPEFPLEMSGEIKGAPYIIRVPENWNGTLLVYAPGYSAEGGAAPDAAFKAEHSSSNVATRWRPPDCGRRGHDG